jgi:hypothetical protein
MRITTDKLDSLPKHGVSASEVRDALSRLPAEWTANVEDVRLSASMKSWEIASFSGVARRLVLCSRGRSKEEVLRALNRELYLHASQTHPKPEWRLSERQKKELDSKLKDELAAVAQEKNA